MDAYHRTASPAVRARRGEPALAGATANRAAGTLRLVEGAEHTIREKLIAAMVGEAPMARG
jgi:hypothetical protein